MRHIPNCGERQHTYGAVDAGEAASLASGEMRVFSDRSRETFGRMEAEPRIDPAASACVCPHSLESRTSGATFATMDGPTRAPSLAGGEQHRPGRDRLEPCSAVIATLHLLATRRPPARQNQPLWCTPQPPCGDRDRPLEREPARTEQAHSAAQPMTPRRAGPTVAPRCRQGREFVLSAKPTAAAADGVRGRDEPPDQAADGVLDWLTARPRRCLRRGSSEPGGGQTSPALA
jgi:hypothetical protein